MRIVYTFSEKVLFVGVVNFVSSDTPPIPRVGELITITDPIPDGEPVLGRDSFYRVVSVTYQYLKGHARTGDHIPIYDHQEIFVGLEFLR